MLIGGYCIGVVEGDGRSDRGRGEEKGAKIGIVIGRHIDTAASLFWLVGNSHGGEEVINAQAAQLTFDGLCKTRSKWMYSWW